MSQPYVGEIRLFAGRFAPRGFMVCDGRVLPIATHDVLFSLIGTTYGGDGERTFALPDMRSRVPVHQGPGGAQPPYVLGQMGGTETVTLTPLNLAPHAHTVFANDAPGDQHVPEANRSHLAALGPDQPPPLHAWQPPGTTNQVLLSPRSTTPAGGGQPHNNIQPSTGITYVIAVEGAIPPRP